MLPGVQDETLEPPGCARTVEGADAERRGDRDTA